MARSRNVSAGLLMYRYRDDELEVFLIHPGGPYTARKDLGAWSIPKGELEPDEHPEDTAVREFKEETGKPAGAPRFPLGSVRQRGGKRVHCWAFAGEWEDDRVLQSNTFELEWPPRSGRMQTWPEVDKAEFFTIPIAREKINVAQAAFLDRLIDLLAAQSNGEKSGARFCREAEIASRASGEARYS